MAALKSAAAAASVALDLPPSAPSPTTRLLTPPPPSPPLSPSTPSLLEATSAASALAPFPFAYSDAAVSLEEVDGAVRGREAGRAEALDSGRVRPDGRPTAGAGQEGRGEESEEEGALGVADDLIFSMLDANGDGVISVEEMREFVKELGAPSGVSISSSAAPLGSREGQGPGAAGSMAVPLDGGLVNGLRAATSSLGKSDYEPSSKEALPQGASGSRDEEEEEWAAARQLVALMDANEDGTVSSDEFAEFRRQVGPWEKSECALAVASVFSQ